jgi:hypothetical protein
MLERSDLNTIEKMQEFARGYFTKALLEPELDLFIVNEFNNNPEVMVGIFRSPSGSHHAQTLLKEIGKSVEKGELKGEPEQIFITLISLCLFSFAGKALMKSMLNFDETEYIKLMEQRKDFVIQFLATAFK